MKIKKITSKALAILLIISIIISSFQLPAFQGVAFAKNTMDGTTKRILIQYKHGTRNTEQRLENSIVGTASDGKPKPAAKDRANAKNFKRLKEQKLFVTELDQAKLTNLYDDSSIQYIEEDSEVQKLDDHITWNIKAVNADRVHNSNVFGAGIKVAVFDTGIDLDHDDLIVSGGISFVEGVESYDDDNGHGTAMAGILASTLN